MSENFQIAPWYNIKEWHEVYEDLYGLTSTFATKQKALDCLLIWKARCPSLPSGVESTLTLLEVHLQDKSSLIQLHSDHLIRLAYSSALMRFVNHMLDTQTAKGQSLFQAAKNLNIPEWIIDMRHDTAHGNKLPQIELLREACTLSLVWLKNYYWDKHKEYIGDYIVGQVAMQRNERENKIEALINFCVSLSICSHPGCNVRTIADVPDATLRESLVNDAKEIIGDSFDYSNLKTITIKNLHHFLTPTVKKILYHDSACTYVNKILLSENSLFLSLELYVLLDKYNYRLKKHLNKAFVQCFEMLLQFLHTYDLLQDFLLELIKRVQSNEMCDKRRKLAALWVSVILKALGKVQLFQEQVMKKASKESTSRSKDLKSLFYHWFPNERNCHLLLDLNKPVPKDLTNINFIQPIISTYNEYLTCFIKDLLNLVRPQLPQPVVIKLCELAKAISSPKKIKRPSKIYTVDDINLNGDTMKDDCVIVIDDNPKDVVEEIIEVKPKCVNKQKYGVFNLASHEHAWSNCPIGLLPWQQTPAEQMDVDIN
ncbi:unnamed protein product [Danaus chrysippus]|uniref:(African queen) hypothetical protein n=1 Tax=Danaus chrysippus TaxID=151541 RepID=A0A8J2W1J4_9NEOP|nr:unnamed protein product [Danaus chrysippus]